MPKIWIFIGNTLVEASNYDPTEDLKICWKTLHPGLLAGKATPISFEEALAGVMSSDMDIVVGHTWIAGFESGKPWQFEETFLCEEFFGPASAAKINMADFMDGANALAKLRGCQFIEFGTRASKSPLALGRMMSKTGAEVSAVVLQREVQ